MHYSRNRILLISLLLEGLLCGFYLTWLYFQPQGILIGWHLLPGVSELAFGALATLPLFALNYLLFGPLSHTVPSLVTCFEFKDRIVKPLADELDIYSAFAVALCAGIGEELFFRGLLQEQFGLFVASVAFSLLHFGPAAARYKFIALLYVLIGVYFGVLYERTGRLWEPITAHVIYDYIALLYMRYVYHSPPRHLSPLNLAA